MKNKTALRNCIFVFILIILLAAADYMSYWDVTRGYINKLTCTDGGRFGYDEVAPSLLTMADDDGTTSLLLGDSVANQLLDPYIGVTAGIRICPINRAITMAGQYILVKEYLSGHPDATDVYIVFYAGTLGSTVDSDLAYQYIAMPFIENGYEDDLDSLVMGKMRNMYGSFFLKPAVLDYIDHSGINRYLYLTGIQKINDLRGITTEKEPVSDISFDYLEKIYDLCMKKGVTPHLISTPVSDSDESRELCGQIQEKFETSGLGEMYPDYCDSFIYCDEDMLMDGVHFSPEYKNRQTLNPYIRQMFGDEDALQPLLNELDQ